MDLRVNVISSSSLARVKASEPGKSSGRLESADSSRSTALSAPSPSRIQPQVEVASPVAVQSRQQNLVDVQNDTGRNESAIRSNSARLQTIKRAVFEHDDVSGLSIVKFMDSKGNVVMQVPPENYLKTVQLLKEFGGIDLQALTGGTENTASTGLLLNKKV